MAATKFPYISKGDFEFYLVVIGKCKVVSGIWGCPSLLFKHGKTEYTILCPQLHRPFQLRHRPIRSFTQTGLLFYSVSSLCFLVILCCCSVSGVFGFRFFLRCQPWHKPGIHGRGFYTEQEVFLSPPRGKNEDSQEWKTQGIYPCSWWTSWSWKSSSWYVCSTHFRFFCMFAWIPPPSFLILLFADSEPKNGCFWCYSLVIIEVLHV